MLRFFAWLKKKNRKETTTPFGVYLIEKPGVSGLLIGEKNIVSWR